MTRRALENQTVDSPRGLERCHLSFIQLAYFGLIARTVGTAKISRERHCEIIELMNATTAVILRTFLVFLVSVPRVLAQAPGGQEQQPEFIKQGQQLMREGKLDDALALYHQT